MWNINKHPYNLRMVIADLRADMANLNAVNEDTRRDMKAEMADLMAANEDLKHYVNQVSANGPVTWGGLSGLELSETPREV